MLPKNCPRNYSNTVLYIHVLKRSVDGIHQLMSDSYCHSSADEFHLLTEQSDVCVRTCLDSILVNLFCTFACGACLRTRYSDGSTTTSSSLLNIAEWMTQPLSTLRNRYPDPFLCVVFDRVSNLIFTSLVDQGNNTETLWSWGIFWWSTKLRS